MGSPQGTTVREATSADVERIAPLFDAYRQFYRKPTDLALARAFLAERLEKRESVVFVAEDAGGAVGFVQLFPSFSSGAAARTFILNDLFVAPRARRRGIASLLLGRAAEHGRATGAVRVTLSTEVVNEQARALYEREGWQLQTEFCVYNLVLNR
jgi:ribosomal protein S18 acetylase RimI-like enzyme